MLEGEEWDDQAREDLRESLRARVRGELRLRRNEGADIVAVCRDICIVETCPENEEAEFERFAAEELERAQAEFESEQGAWPAETDCDRLDRVEAALRERGILLWQASPCCDTCSGAELPDRVRVIESRDPGFTERARGYCFFIDQMLPETLADQSELSLYLAYGWFSPDGTPVPDEQYVEHALGIAHEVCECLRSEGFEVDWDGDIRRKVGFRIDWKRRTLLD